MRPQLGLAGLMAFGAFAAHAATITTNTFAIEVPDRWKVEDDKASVVIASGVQLVDGAPLPFLIIQYCVAADVSPDAGSASCRRTCREEAEDMVSRASIQGQVLAPLSASERNGATEFRAELVSPGSGVTFTALSCKGRTQVQMGLVSDAPREWAMRHFEDILGSLRWK